MRLRLLGSEQRSGPPRAASGGASAPPCRRRGGVHPRYSAAVLRSAVAGLSLLVALPAGAGTFSSWQYRQELSLLGPGLIKLDLPPDTLDAARPEFEDLRIVDPSGGEVPYLIERGSATGKVSREAKSLRMSLGKDSTVLTLETGLANPLDGIALTTAAETFIKGAQVDGSTDGKHWRTLARGLPIFRQRTGISQLQLPFPAGTWPFLRVTVDDRRSPPVAFTDARVQVAARDPIPPVPVEVRITERMEGPGETRLMLDLGAAHLRLTALRIDSPDPLFTRHAAVAARQVEGDVIRERTLAEGAIFRIALPGRPVSSQLTIPGEFTTPSRVLLLRIRNEDSPPLQIAAVHGERRPVYIIFMARQGGPHAILTDNRLAPAPRYDLASLGLDFKAAATTPIRPSAIGSNPDFHPGDAVPQASAPGPALDVSAWSYRKPVQTTGAGMQELELDLDVLSRALPSLADLRLMSHGRQLPYIFEQTSMTRALVPHVAPADDPRKPKLSRWAMTLSHRNLPLTRLVCTTATPLFRREVSLSEEATDARGSKQPRHLGRATWVRTPEQHSQELSLPLASRPTTETLFLETDNQDNPPITLEQCKLFYPVWRIHFPTASEAYLYYGNRRAELPRYDLSLISAQVLTVEQAPASLGAEERSGNAGWPERMPLMWRGGILLWTSLAVVVVGLLVIISRLLPKPPPPAGP